MAISDSEYTTKTASLPAKGSSSSLGEKNHKKNRSSGSSRGCGGNQNNRSSGRGGNHNNYSRGGGGNRNKNGFSRGGSDNLNNDNNYICGGGSHKKNSHSGGGNHTTDPRRRGGNHNNFIRCSVKHSDYSRGGGGNHNHNHKSRGDVNHIHNSRGGSGDYNKHSRGGGKHNISPRGGGNHKNFSRGGSRNHGGRGNNVGRGQHQCKPQIQQNTGSDSSSDSSDSMTASQNKQQQTNHENSTQCNDVNSKTVNKNELQGKLDELEQELSKIVGLEELKVQLRTFAKRMLMDEKRRAMGIELGPRKSPHMVFLGNPGTGKTTIARILGKLLCAVGVLSEDKLTEVQRSDLVAEYIGQTATKTKEKIEEAMGGVLFVDEAYRLAIENSSGSWTDYGVEALEEIMSVLEDENIVIFAGYSEPMKRVFSTNEGFTRRVTIFFQFDDFSCHDLAEMLMIKMTKQNNKSHLYGFKLHPSCTLKAVRALIERNSTEKLRSKLNGGLVDHMLNNARANLDSRLSFDSKGDELLTITMKDLEAGVRVLTERIKVE